MVPTIPFIWPVCRSRRAIPSQRDSKQLFCLFEMSPGVYIGAVPRQRHNPGKTSHVGTLHQAAAGRLLFAATFFPEGYFNQ
jgi:hypothetical protein